MMCKRASRCCVCIVVMMLLVYGRTGESARRNRGYSDIPDRQNTTGLGEASLLLDTTDALLEDGRNLGRGGLCVGGVGSSLDGGSVDSCGCGISSLGEGKYQVSRNPKKSAWWQHAATSRQLSRAQKARPASPKRMQQLNEAWSRSLAMD